MRLAPLLALTLPAAAAAAPPTLATMRDHRRMLIVASPTLVDARLAAQRRELAGWRHGARDRDVAMVEVAGDRVVGAADRATLMRRQWHLPPGDFQVVLVGKDGHEALRSPHPIAARTLERAIDAMPMRRAGQR